MKLFSNDSSSYTIIQLPPPSFNNKQLTLYMLYR